MTLSFTIRHQYQIDEEPILISVNTCSQHPMYARFFQSLLTFSPVSGVVPMPEIEDVFRQLETDF